MSPASEKMDMRIACSGIVADELPLAKAVERMGEMGFRALDLFAHEWCNHVKPSRLATGMVTDVAGLPAVLSRIGLRVTAINIGHSRPLNDPSPAARRQVAQEHRAVLDLAEAVGCRVLTVQTGPFDTSQDTSQSLGLARDGLARLSELGHDRQVRLTFEPHKDTVVEDPARALQLVQSLWPVVGITYDPSHFAMQDIPLERTEALLPYTVHVHLRDAAPGRMQAPAGSGTVDFGWLAAALARNRYAGAVTIEYLASPEIDAPQEEAARLRQILLGLGLTD